ncbi:MAG: ABC-F family ATP-binding cassette domain-containing protein [Clostridiaceae bacterium]|nr:ABC-F family ATP-binding cassette domain-containing protein [Clostridiaceae bacterium]MDY5889146.1 ABC-F family ATP-binding cassette domain-containing protein [Oscillospiraceae bacterium]
MTVLSFQNLAFSFGERELFRNVNFDINDKEKVGFIGSNGVGKTTILKLIRGELEPTEGAVIIGKDARLGYMEQHTCSKKGRTLYDELIIVFDELMDLEIEINQVNYRLEHGLGNMEEDLRLQDELTTKFNNDGGLTFRSRTRSALLGLGFTEEDFGLTTDKLSGGQRSKVALAKLLLSKSNLLLLDEPTNHLDIKSVEWLEGFLKNYNGAIFVISHDRYFLDRITDKTVELENRKVRCFKGNYSEFLVKKKAEQQAIEDKYEADMREIQRLEGVVAQQRQWNREKNIKTAESKLKQIERIKEQLVIPDSKVERIRFHFEPKCVSGNDVIIADGLSKSFGNKLIFKNASLHITRGERVFILGDNGCGKTTFLKTLMGQYAPDDGTFMFGENLFKGYFDQVQAGLDLNKTAIEEIWSRYPKMTQTQVRSALAAFLFKGDDVFKKISELSGGERARIALLSLMLGGYNLLLLDEPTNHLDAFSREELENTLLDYDGTMLIVSHDRYFINKLSTRILELSENGFTEYLGDYDYYIEKRASRQPAETQVKAAKPEKVNDYKLKKEQASQQRKLKTQLSRTENEIAELEKEIENIQEKLNSTEVQSDYEKLIEFTDLLNSKNDELMDKYSLWDELQGMIEE